MVSRKFCRAERVRLVSIALGASALAAIILPVQFATTVEAKTPGSTYCYYGVCHRVKTLEETSALVGVEETITASHYDDCSKDRYNPCGLTSSGERFHPDRPDNTASPIYPDGTTLLVWSPDTERALVVRVNNAGPYWGNRTLDLSRAAAEKLGFEGKGVATLRVRVIKAPDPEEATYVANRDYMPVPGDIGEYGSLYEAQFGMAVALALQASAASPLAPVTTANAFATGSERAEPLVAEAPQALGRAHGGLASLQPVSSSVPLGGPGWGASLFKSLAQQSNAQSRRQLALLGADRKLSQSTWGLGWDPSEDDPIETGSIDDASDDGEAAESAKPVASSGNSDGDEKAAAAAAAAERERAKEKREAARRESRKETAERAARKSKARVERRPRNSRTARYEGRRSREQAEFSTGGYERRAARPGRSTEQITSLGIRAEPSSM